MPQTPAPTPTPIPTPGPIIVQVPPVPPVPPIEGIPSAYGHWAIPGSPAEMAILQAQREALSNQVINVRDRRNEIARAYERASGANRSGLEQQLRVLDQRILQLEQDLSESGRALASARIGSQTGTLVSPRIFNLNSGQVTAVSIVFILFVLGPLAASLGRLLWRRSSKPAAPPGWYDASQRLERLEQAVDTIAIEVERVSEGQRFMTKLMTQGVAAAENAAGAPAAVNGAQPLPALGAGSPEQFVSQKQRDEVRARRS
jgi:hypothetical protein